MGPSAVQFAAISHSKEEKEKKKNMQQIPLVTMCPFLSQGPTENLPFQNGKPFAPEISKSEKQSK